MVVAKVHVYRDFDNRRTHKLPSVQGTPGRAMLLAIGLHCNGVSQKHKLNYLKFMNGYAAVELTTYRR